MQCTLSEPRWAPEDVRIVRRTRVGQPTRSLALAHANQNSIREGILTTTYLVIGEHLGESGEPFAARAGEAITVTGGADLWQDRPEWIWVWCRDTHGRAGFVPQSYLAGEGQARILTTDYTARELPLRPGQRVDATLIESGWAWSEAADGQTGWAPLAVLQVINEQ